LAAENKIANPFLLLLDSINGYKLEELVEITDALVKACSFD
jgi:hypothetical protein